ncbi:MAG: hypothetical protein ABSG68_16125 [Thermoguttaceae bacterium]|jgi:hypothetical protein
MSKKRVVKMTQFSILSPLAVMLAICIAGQDAHAAAPTAGAAPATASPGAAAIEKAAKDNKFLFIFFWKDDTQHSRVMRGVFQAALAKLTDAAQSVEIRTEDPAEQPIVARYGVSRAPMPLVLALAPNGAITKGLPTQFDDNQIRQAFVSRGTAGCMKALQDRKFVLLCVRQSSAQGAAAAIPAGVKNFAADPQYAPYTKVEVLNPGDPAETSFLKSLQVDPHTAVAVTLLMVPPGFVAGTFAGDVSKEELVARLKAAQASCGPGCACHH